MQEQPRESSVMVHNAYNAKKCIPVGLYRLLCLEASGAMNCGAAHVSEPDCCAAWHLMSKKSLQMFSLCKKIYFVSLTTRPATCRTGAKTTPRTGRLLLWSCISTDVCVTSVITTMHFTISCSRESCNVHLQRNVNWALFVQPSSRCSNKAMKLNKPLG